MAESPRGEGPRRAFGELIFCPPCVGQWVAGGFLAGLFAAPRATRAVAGLFAVQAVSDFLHVGFQAGRDRLSG